MINACESPLAIRVPLQPRETLASFLSRTSAANGIENSRTFCLDMGLNLDDAINGRTEAIEAVALLCGVPIIDLVKWSVIRLPDRAFSLAGHVVPRFALQPAALAFCPYCVRAQFAETGLKGIYMPAENYLSGYRTCIEHEVALLPLPYRGHYQTVYDHCRRIADDKPIVLRECEKPGQQRRSSNLEHYIIRRLTGVSTNCWLDEWELNAVFKTSEILGAVLNYGSQVRLTGLSDEEWHVAGKVGFDAIRESRASILDIFGHIKRRERERPHCSLTYLGAFYNWLSFGAKHMQFEPVKEILREHASKNHAFGEGDIILGKPCPERHLHTISSACLETGLHRVTMARILRLAGHISPKQSKQHSSTMTFPAIQIQDLIDQVNTTMPQTKAQEFLNISRPQFNTLKDAGILKSRKLYKGAFGTYAKADLECFWQRLSQWAISVSSPSDDMYPISLAANMAVCPASDVFKMLIRGEIRAVEKVQCEKGVGSLRVNILELRRLLALPEDDWLFRSQLAKLLGIDDWGLRALFDLGYLTRTRQRNPITRKVADAVSRSSVATFMAEYISLKNYAAEQNVSVQKLSHRLKKDEITPISLPTGVRSQIFVRDILPNDSIPNEPSDVSGHHR